MSGRQECRDVEAFDRFQFAWWDSYSYLNWRMEAEAERAAWTSTASASLFKTGAVFSRVLRDSTPCFVGLSVCLSHITFFFSFSGLWLHGSCPSDQVISNMSHAHPHATGVAVNPALFLLVLFCDHFTVYVYVLHWALSPNITCGSYSILLFKPSPHARRDPLTCFC